MNKPIASDGTVGKALEVLDAVAEFGKPVRFSDLLENSPYPKATLYRFLQTLTNQNMLSYNEQLGTYSLGVRLMRLAHGAWSNATLAPIARAFIQDLAEQTSETIHLAQLDNGQVLFVDKIRKNARFDTLARIGQVAPTYCTGVGKAMLAFLAPKRLEIVLQQQSFYQYTPTTHTRRDSLIKELDMIRETSIAFDREEHEQGIASIATPILSANGRVLGAISIATSTMYSGPTELEKFKPSLIETAQKIGEEATSWQFPS